MSLILVLLLVALVFEYINGFHDTANAIATSVGTKVLTPVQAVAIAAVFDLVGALSGTAVAKTISSGLVDASFAVPTANNGTHTVGVVGTTSGSIVKDAFIVGPGLASNPATASPGRDRAGCTRTADPRRSAGPDKSPRRGALAASRRAQPRPGPPP